MATPLNVFAQTLTGPRQIQGVALGAGTQVVFGFGGELALCVLPSDQVVSDVPCRAGFVHFHPSGALAEATLAAPFAVGSAELPAGARLTWNEDGTVSAQLQSSPVKIGETVLPEGATARLSAAGHVLSWSRRCALTEHVAGLPCEAGSVVTCFAGGRPERLTLAEAHVVEALPCMAGTDLEFHANGRVAALTLGEAATLCGLALGPGTELVFRPDGTLSMAQLVEDCVVAGVSYGDGVTLLFDLAGHLSGTAGTTWTVSRVART